LGIIGTLQTWVRVMRHCKTALPSETLDQLERRAARSRWWRPDWYVWHSFDARRQWGYGDYTRKENRGEPCFSKKFLSPSLISKATKLFVIELPKLLVSSPKNAGL
jgi:hypothetical protein